MKESLLTTLLLAASLVSQTSVSPSVFTANTGDYVNSAFGSGPLAYGQIMDDVTPGTYSSISLRPGIRDVIAFQADFEIRISWNTVSAGQLTGNFANMHNGTMTVVVPRAVRNYPLTPISGAPPFEPLVANPPSHTFTFSSPITVSGSVFVEILVYSTNIPLGEAAWFDAFWNRTSPEPFPIPFFPPITQDFGQSLAWRGYSCGTFNNGNAAWSSSQFAYDILTGDFVLHEILQGPLLGPGEIDSLFIDFGFASPPVPVPVTEDQGTTFFNCDGRVGPTSVYFPGNNAFTIPFGPWSPSFNFSSVTTQRYRLDQSGKVAALSSPQLAVTDYRWGSGNGPAPAASTTAGVAPYQYGQHGLIFIWNP